MTASGDGSSTRFTANPEVREEPFADVTLDLANRSRRIDRLYVVGRAGGVGKSIVEPALHLIDSLSRICCASAPLIPDAW